MIIKIEIIIENDNLNKDGDNVKSKKIKYIISILILIISLIIGISIINNNNKLVYTKKNQVIVNNFNDRKNKIINELNDLRKEQDKEYKKDNNSKNYKKISEKVDKLNSEKADIDIRLENLKSKRIIDYKKMIPGIIIIILGIVGSTMLFIRTRKIELT